MLQRLTVRNFKSFRHAAMEFPRLAVLFGPNAVGKSNLLDAIQALSRIGTQRTLADALGEPIRGYPFEMFKLPAGGFSELLTAPTAQFSLEADLAIRNGAGARRNLYRYEITVEVSTGAGSLTNRGEYLAALTEKGGERGKPAIETEDNSLIIRRQGGGRPRSENLGQNYAVLSDPRLGQPSFTHIERVRSELLDWRTYYLEPRLAMRAHMPPMDIYDIGVCGEYIAPFLYKLKSEHKTRFDGIIRTVRTIIPNIETLDVELDKRRGTLDLFVRQNGTDFPSRLLSEGTLRLIALCAIAVNPWSGSLLAFEEPENGVHPRRIELIARILAALATEKDRQLVVTTHSPLFCGAVLQEARSRPNGDIGLFTFHTADRQTEVRPFSGCVPQFENTEIVEALTSGREDGLFEEMVMRGLIDE